MSIPIPQNFYKETVTTQWSTGAGNFYVSTKPTASIGYLVISPGNPNVREIVKFTAVGTDGNGDYVTIQAANRGLGDTTDQVHAIGESVYMNVTAEHVQEISDAIDQIVAAGAQDASTITKGVTKLSVAPDSATEPIAVGANDFAILPTVAQKSALVGDGGTPSSTNPYKLKSLTKLAGETITGATLPVPVYQNKSDNEFYACDANDVTKMKFIGFAVSNGTDGNNIEIQTSGIVSGFTGLAEGEKYYVQDAVGTIGTTIGTNEILVGIAISETQLVIQKGRRRASGDGTTLGTASGSLVVSCGFRPSIVRINAMGASSSVITTMQAIWVNGAIRGITGMYNEGTTGTFGIIPVIYSGGGTGDFMTFSITSVTDTGFTITWTETGSFPSAVDPTFIWEAEGEL